MFNMANTYTQIYLQFVFAVKNRSSIIHKDWKEELYKYITGVVQNNGHKMIAINGMSDHIHIFIGYKPNQPIPDLLKDIKGSSSTWINEKGFVRGKFRWQAGYGAFSYSQTQIDSVAKYVMNQEEHHKKTSFREEYLSFLDRYNVVYKNEYIFHDVQLSQEKLHIE